MLRFTRCGFVPSASTPATVAAAPLKVLVLTMCPNGGAMTPALRILGYNPYIFEHTYRVGNAMSHTKEWRAVLLRQKPFDPVILQAKPNLSKEREEDKQHANTTSKKADEVARAAERDFDAIVGPPGTLAYEAILQTCPRSTRVILVEEPDKLAWEKEFTQIIEPLLEHTRTRGKFVSLMADLHRMLESMTEVRRTVSVQKKPNTSGSAQRLGALQASTLKLGAALDLFEAQVKETVPRDRLLVYCIGEGWGPLCTFLGVPAPTASTTEGDEREVIPFPPHDPGTRVFSDLRDRLHGADRAALVVFLMGFALALVLLAAFNTPVKVLVDRYRERFNALLMPYFDQYKKDGTPVTLRGALKLSKKATMDLEAEVREEGGVVSGFKDAVSALSHPYGDAAAPPTGHKGQ